MTYAVFKIVISNQLKKSNKREKSTIFPLRSRKLHKKGENKFKTVLTLRWLVHHFQFKFISPGVSHLFHVSSARGRVPALLHPHSARPERRSARTPQPEPPVSCSDASKATPPSSVNVQLPGRYWRSSLPPDLFYISARWPRAPAARSQSQPSASRRC